MINDVCDPDIVKILVGNKFDLRDSRKLDNYSGHELAKEFKMDRYMETSAVRDINVSDVIDTLLGRVQKKSLKGKNLRATISLIQTETHTTIIEGEHESSSN